MAAPPRRLLPFTNDSRLASPTAAILHHPVLRINDAGGPRKDGKALCHVSTLGEILSSAS